MNKEAVLHIMDSAYCFPISPNEIVIRLRTAKNDWDKVEVLFESKYVIGEKHKNQVMTKRYVGDIFDWYEVKLQLEDTRLAYVFYLTKDSESFYFSEDGLTKEYDFSLGFYNYFQYAYINDADIVKTVPWMNEARFYQIFTDRFCIGSSDKDLSYINIKWGEKPNPKSFAGGDLWGVTEKLDYIKEIGCNAIYLTPVFKSISNHKYDISDYYSVDEQFGGNEALKTLVKEAHSKDIKIVLDAVFNHGSDKSEQFVNVINKGKESKYYDWFVIYGDKIDTVNCNYETFASCKYMPKWNTSNKEVQDFLLDIAVYYIKEYGIDGWRLDVADEVSNDFWRKFRTRVKECNENAVIIGENWHDAYSNLMGEQFDSIMNYSFTKLCLDYFANGKKTALEAAYKLNEILIRNKDGINNSMLNLLDSHDTHRFFKEVDSDRDKIKSALSLLYFYKGVPCIFYGTEILTYGGFDPDCRRCMDWGKADFNGEYKDVYKLIRTLSDLRANGKWNSGQMWIDSVDNMLHLKNVVDDDTYDLYINMTEENMQGEYGKVYKHGFIINKNGGLLINEEC